MAPSPLNPKLGADDSAPQSSRPPASATGPIRDISLQSLSQKTHILGAVARIETTKEEY
jgi:hypothetical protein